MKCKYVRIQGREDSYITKYPKGVFSLCWNLVDIKSPMISCIRILLGKSCMRMSGRLLFPWKMEVC